ncbi:enoyl-CoA hydratase-related protein [Xanthomonas sp. MUS 060]|uniref:enoyl-CoA hydratase-related protein n=1 Tax=Xanthomonas sp. MUS 060 TaxID=1588031 RepID=UPI0005F293B4|nr:enoyl-CoA hydratase-related protein [Xanthomonas sp. MUS 060]
MSDALLLERSGKVLALQLNRPALRNAFDVALIAQLTDALQQIAVDPLIQIVVLGGTGSAFSAGADLQWMRAMAAASAQDNHDDAMALARLMRVLDELPKPTVARVHGAAFGGAVGLIACCDIAVASTDARFALSESRLGLLPAVISPYVIAAIGARQARRWFASAEPFDATTAAQIGLVHEVVAPQALDAAVQQQVALLGQAGPLAAAAAKTLVRRVAAGGERDALDQANATLIAQLRVSPEGQEGLGAFLEKRTPRWIGQS